MFIPENIIEAAVEIALNTRDLCGNERQALIEFAQEQGLEGQEISKLRRIATFRANNVWRKHQRAAGVPEKHILG